MLALLFVVVTTSFVESFRATVVPCGQIDVSFSTRKDCVHLFASSGDRVDADMDLVGRGNIYWDDAKSSRKDYELPDNVDMDASIVAEVDDEAIVPEVEDADILEEIEEEEDDDIIVESTTISIGDTVTIGVALTREAGKNSKLIEAIVANSKTAKSSPYKFELEVFEIPCILHAEGSDYDTLKYVLESHSLGEADNTYDYVVVTSPEAAKVLASVWPWSEDSDIKSPPPQVAAVGLATDMALKASGIYSDFVPSKATAQTLVDELPSLHNGDAVTKVLYPASAIAADVLQAGLEARGSFSVSRLDTYDTIAATWNGVEKNTALNCQIACFASPSAVKGWLQNTDGRVDVFAACIGETSARACRKNGWDDAYIFYPPSPGMDGWVDAIVQAATTIAAESAK
jgi:uroporphyrinogen-III synthase